MGLLDKWLRKFAPGGGGDRIVRTKTTYGKNLDRSVDMNGLINDIQNNYGLAANITTNTADIATNTTTNTNQGYLIKTAQVSGKSAAQVNTGFYIEPGKSGIAYLPIMGVVTASSGSTTAETANKTLQIKWDDDANGIPLVVGKFMQSVTTGGRYVTYQFIQFNDATAAYNPGSTDALDTKGLFVTGNGAFNGDWVIQSLWVMYAEVNCSGLGVMTTIG